MSSQDSQLEGEKEISITLRIPAGRFEEAEDALTRAVALDPKAEDFRERLAQVQKRQQPVLPPRG